MPKKDDVVNNLPEEESMLPQTEGTGEGTEFIGADEIVDFSKVEDGFPLFPAGLYPAFVFDLKMQPNKAKDAMKITWNFKLAGGSYTKATVDGKGELVSLVGRRLFYDTSLKPQALWKLRNTIKAVNDGVEPGAMSMQALFAWMQENLLGKSCDLEVIVDTYNNKESNKVNEVYTAGSLSKIPRETFNENDIPFL